MNECFIGVLGTKFALRPIILSRMRRLKAIFCSVFRAMKDWVVTLVTAKKHKSCSTRTYLRAREEDMCEEIVWCIE